METDDRFLRGSGLVGGLRGTLLCWVRIFGQSGDGTNVYAYFLCQKYADHNGVAEAVSGRSEAVLLTAAGPTPTATITGFKIPGPDEQEARDIRAWFPADIAEQALNINTNTGRNVDLAQRAQALLLAHELPSYDSTGYPAS